MRRNLAIRVVLAVAAVSSLAGAGPAAAQESTPRPLRVVDLFRIQDVSSPALSPDGSRIAYLVSGSDLDKNTSYSEIWMVPVAGGAPRRMTREKGSVGAPRFSPDGRLLTFIDTRGDEAKAQVWSLSLEGGEAVALTDIEQGVAGFAWGPRSERLALRIRDRAPARNKDRPQPPWVIDRLQFKQDHVGYLDRRRNHLYVFELATKQLTRLTAGDYDDAQMRWSPDGEQLAFVSNRTEEPDSNYNTDVWVVEARAGETPEMRRVSTSRGSDSGPAWSPDGTTLAWLTTTRPELHGYAMQYVAVGAPGREPHVLTEALDRNVRQLRFRADGKAILGILESEAVQSLVSVDVESGATIPLGVGDRRVDDFVQRNDGPVAIVASSVGRPAELWAIAGDDLQPLTHHNDDLMAGLRRARVETAWVTAEDGARTQALFTFPPDAVNGEALPTILWIHGGPMGQDDLGWDGQRQLFAAHGYLVVQPNYRGSHGYGQEIAAGLWQKWGGPERMDSIAAVDHAVARGWADPDRLAVGGWSYGGITTNAVITSTDRFKAAISGASDALWIAAYGHDQYQRWYEYELGLPWENRDLWERLSTYNRVERITTPTLWIGGEKDWNVPIMQSELMYQAMRRLGRDTLLVVYPGQGHWGFPPVYESDVYHRFLGWYGKYLLGDDSLWPKPKAVSEETDAR